jgi:hypothetical protein
MSNILTRDYIVKTCVKQGFYRTPSCNEKLYLHHQGFDAIDPVAFHDYTDVKVLWLEGNCFSQLPIQPAEFPVKQPPAAVVEEPTKAAAVDVTEEVEETSAADAGAKEITCEKEIIEATDEQENVQTGETTGVVDEVEESPEDKVTPAQAEQEATSRSESAPRDVFASLYPTLRQFYLHNNMLQAFPPLSRFHCLDSVNLGDNFIKAVGGGCVFWERADDDILSVTASPSKSADAVQIANAKKIQQSELIQKWSTVCEHSLQDNCPCATVTTLHLKNNQLKTLEGLSQLLCFKKLSVLDLSSNKIEDGNGLLEILERLGELKSLYLSGNPCVRTIANYRKTVISRCKKLMHLDDRPVFDDERRLVAAWAKGGNEAEKKERQTMREEEEARVRKRLEDFRALMRGARDGRDGLDTTTEEDTDSNPTPDSSEEGDEKKTTTAASTNEASTQRQGSAGRSNFYQENYEVEARALSSNTADTQPPSAPTSNSTAGHESVTWSNFTISRRSEPAATTRRTVQTTQHCDPCANDDEVWVPGEKK